MSPNPLQLLPNALVQSQLQITYGEIAAPAPLSTANLLYVVLPDWSRDHPFVVAWSQDHGAALPQVGAACILVRDSRGFTRCVWWDGAYASPTVTAINGSPVPLTSSAWVPVSGGVGYQNSWATSTSCTPAAYLKDPLGFVHLRGRITGGTTASVAFTLPVGYRPGGTNDTFAAAGWSGASAGAAFVNLNSSFPGQVFIYYAAGFTDVGLAGITFLAEK